MYFFMANSMSRYKIFYVVFALLLTGCDFDNSQSSDATSHLTRSKAYQEIGQYRAAIIEAQNIIQKGPQLNSGFIQLANLYLEIGNPEAASMLLTQVPNPDAESYLLEAESFAIQGKFLSTDTSLEQYREHQGDINSAKYQLIHMQVKAYQEGSQAVEQELEQLASQLPENLEIQNLLARFYIAHEKLDKASDLVEKTLSKHSEHAQSLYMAAQISHIKNDLDMAETHLSNALIAIPQTDIILPIREKILRQLSTVLTELGRTNEALVYAKVLADANPEANEARSKFLESMKLLETGDVEGAEVLLTDINERHPHNNLTSIYLGLINYQKGDIQSANDLFSRAIDIETATPGLIAAAADAKLRLEQNEEALSILEQAIEQHPDNFLLQRTYGVTALSTPDNLEAGILALRKAIALNPKAVRTRAALALSYLRQRNTSQALIQLEQALQEAPADILINTLYVQTLLTSDNQELADKVIANLIANQKENAETFILAGQYSLATGKPQIAKQHFEKSLALESSNQVALSTMGSIALQENNAEQAHIYFEKMIAAWPENERAYKGLVSAYELSNNHEQAINILEDYSTQEKHQIAAVVASEYYLRRNNIIKAEQLLSSLKGPIKKSAYYLNVSATLQFALATKSARQEDWSSARKYLLTAIEQTPQREQLYNALADVEIRSQQYNEAEKIIRQIENQFPQSITPILAKAKLYLATNKKPEAADLLSQQWKTTNNPAFAVALYPLITEKESAQALLKEWREKNPQDTRPIFLQAATAQQANEAGEAIALYEQILELTPNNPAALNNLAWLYFEAKDPRAEQHAKKAYELAPSSAEILDTYGWILVNTGQRALGREILEKAVELAPNNTEILQHYNSSLD